MTFKEFYYYSTKIEREEEREWQRQAVMMSLHANMSGSKKKFKPEDFNPFAKKTKGGTVSSKEDVAALREKILNRNKAKKIQTD